MEDQTMVEGAMEQRMIALVKANHVRMYRAELKRNVASGEVSVADVMELLRDPPDKLKTMKAYELICAIPRVGPTKATKVLRRAQASVSSRIGNLSRPSLEVICLQLQHWDR